MQNYHFVVMDMICGQSVLGTSENDKFGQNIEKNWGLRAPEDPKFTD